METSSSLMKNTTIVFIGTIVRMFCSFVLVLIVTRTLGPEGTGVYSVVLSLFWLFQKIATMGLEPICIREIAKNHSRAGSLVANSTVIGIIFSVIMSGCMWGFTYIATYPGIVRVSAIVMSGTLVFTTGNLFFQAMFIGLERTELGVSGIVAENLIRVGAGAALLVSGYSIFSVFIVFLCSSALRLGINLYFTIKFVDGFRWSYSKEESRFLFKTMPVFAGSQIFNAFSGNITVIILSLLLGMDAVGYYSVAMQLVGFIRLALQSYKSAIQPVAARIYDKSVRELRKFTKKSLTYLFLFIIPVCFGGVMLSDKIVLLLFSEEFLYSAYLLRYLIFLSCVYGVSMVLSVILIGSNNQKIDFWGIVLNMSVRIGVVIVLVPRIQVWGAVVAVLVSATAGAFYRYSYIRRHFFRIPFGTIMYKTVFAAGLMSVCTYALRSIHVAAAVSVSAAVYLALVLAMKIITPGQIPGVRLLLNRKRAS